jgi:major type 1 subunit fimbrin (pilin)
MPFLNLIRKYIMEKIKSLASLSAVAALLSVSGFALAADPVAVTVNGGTINFTGEVVNAACAVDASSSDQTVQMGQVRSASFKALGDTSGKVAFKIGLNDCDASVYTSAAVGFTGQTVSGKTDALAVGSGTAAVASATGIGISILDQAGSKVTFDGTASGKVKIINGQTVIPLQAQYVSTAASVTAGQANATTTFKITYS